MQRACRGGPTESDGYRLAYWGKQRRVPELWLTLAEVIKTWKQSPAFGPRGQIFGFEALLCRIRQDLRPFFFRFPYLFLCPGQVLL
jgi:hypothetical protein